MGNRLSRFLSRNFPAITGGLSAAAMMAVLLADPATAAAQRRGSQRFSPRTPTTAAPTPAAAEPTAARPGDVTAIPEVPMPSVRKPGGAAPKFDDLGTEENPIIEGGADKLPKAHEVNPGNVLVQEAFKKSESANNEGDFSEIIALCEEGIKNGATRENAAYARKLAGWAYNRRGERFAELGNEEEALKDFSKALSNDPNHWRAIHNRGVSYASLGKPHEAINDFSRALQLNRNYANTWFNRGEIYMDRGDFGRAVADYTEAIRLSPKDAAFHDARGRAYIRLGRTRDALEDLNTALRLEPKNAAAYASRGELYLAHRDYGRAAQDFRQAIQLDEKLGSAYRGAAWIMATCPDEQYRDAELALQTAQKALELDGDKDPRYIDTLAAAYASSGQYDSAVAILETHMARVPQNWQAALQARIQIYKNHKPLYEAHTLQQQQQQQQQQQRQQAGSPQYRQPQMRGQQVPQQQSRQQPTRQPQQTGRRGNVQR